MKILFIYPEFPDAFWDFRRALPFISKRAALPPLGLITVAAMLPSTWEVRLADMNVTRLDNADLAWADYVFIGAMVVQRKSAEKLIDFCHSVGKKIVAGGPLFTMEHGSFPKVDYFILNEAEITLPLWLADLKRGALQRVYRSEKFANLNNSPIPRWDLLDIGAYANMCLQYSRGCPFGCDFCNVFILNGNRTRVKTAKRMIIELNSLLATGWQGTVFLADDNSIGDKQSFKTKLLPALIAWQKRTGHRVFFSTEASINLADDQELINLMVATGFNSVFIGVETPNQAALAECGKKQNLGRDPIAAVKILQRAGLQVTIGLVLGFDADNLTIFKRQFDLAMKGGIPTVMAGILNAPFGTKLWHRLKQAGRLREHVSGDNADGSTNVITLMDAEVLHDGYRRLMKDLYTPRHYYRRVRTFLREYRAPSVHQVYQRFNLQRLLALFRVSWRLGLIERGRFGYWLMLIWVVCRRQLRLLPMAIELLATGYHFRKVTESHIQ